MKQDFYVNMCIILMCSRSGVMWNSIPWTQGLSETHIQPIRREMKTGRCRINQGG